MANITENRAMELMDAMHNGEFDEHREWDCAVTAMNHEKTLEKLKNQIEFYQKGVEKGRYTEDWEEIRHWCNLGETAAKHYYKLFPNEFRSWKNVMDMPTRCACGKRIYQLVNQH